MHIQSNVCNIDMAVTIPTRLKILKVARKAFSSIQFQHITMLDIAHSAHLARRTLYTHFKSKEALFSAVVEEEVRTYLVSLKAIAEKEEMTSRERLAAYFERRYNVLFRLVKNNPCIRKDFFASHRKYIHVRKVFEKEELPLLQHMLLPVFPVREEAAQEARTLYVLLKGLEHFCLEENFSVECRRHYNSFAQNYLQRLFLT